MDACHMSPDLLREEGPQAPGEEEAGIRTGELPNCALYSVPGLNNGDTRFDCGFMCVKTGSPLEKRMRTILWYEQEAEAGDPEAQYMCARLMLQEEGGPPLQAKARYWAERSAGQGYNPARFLCGELYRRGVGVEEDPLRALGFYLAAARDGHRDAMWQCASHYLQMRDQDSIREGMYWVEKAAAAGHEKAREFLEERARREQEARESRRRQREKDLHTAVEEYRRHNYTRALNLFETLSQADITLAQFYCGQMYYLGRGTAVDEEKALSLFLRAAEKGHARSQYYCGQMYSFGEGTEKDPVAARRWFEKAAEQGDSSAQFNCGLMYLNGTGGEADRERATMWFQKAADQGNARARLFLPDDEEDEEEEDDDPLS